jgi:quinol monooxygenase YgiN
MNKYGLHGKIQAQPGKGEELATILVQASSLVSTAKECHLYLVSKDTQDKDCISVTEAWDSKEDHDDSLKIAGVRELIAQAMPIIAGPPQKGMELKVIGGI